jgi:uncharacterized protein (TIGR02677 family)
VAALRYVTEQNAPTYRAIVQVFHEARQSYVIELRVHDIIERVQAAALVAELSSEDQVNYHLDHLVEWGNLARVHDAASVTSLQDFYRRRYLYHLTAVGETAHRAVVEVENTAGKSGSLQASMLGKIRDALISLSAAPGDATTIHGLLHDLQSAFETLTQEANRFISDLDRQAAAERAEEERFMLYKRALVAYLSRFLQQLRPLADEIRNAIAGVERAGAERLISIAASSPDLPPALHGIDPIAQYCQEQLARWSGIRTWFVGGGAPGERCGAPTVERLAEVAVEAVISLTRALGRLNERRARPVDRAADFRRLARWFSEAQDDRAAHALFHVAFGLGSARHYHLIHQDPETVPPSTSFWDAPPVEVPIRLRTHGALSHAGKPSAAPDHAFSRQWLAQKRRREREQVKRAQAHFTGLGQICIADLATLDPAQFDLLLSLIDQALASGKHLDGSRTTVTSDGLLRITLRPPRPLRRELVRIQTPNGNLHCLNYRLEVEDVLAASRGPASSQEPA